MIPEPGMTTTTRGGDRPLRVLIVEDSFMTARALGRLLEEFGAKVIGPAPSVKKAMELLDGPGGPSPGKPLGCDAAVLDINLGNETVERVASRLDELGLPFVFVSGYTSPKTMLHDPRYSRRRLVHKPVDPPALKRVLAEVFGGL